MAKRVIDADTILNQAKPLTHQHAHEIQPFGHLVKLPIALAEKACAPRSIRSLGPAYIPCEPLRSHARRRRRRRSTHFQAPSRQ